MTEQPKLWRDMTAEEKGEIALARLEGREVQRMVRLVWTVDYMIGGPDDDASYRVKPEPKVETWIIQGHFNERFGWSFNPESHENDTHQIILTIIDGEVQREAIVERIAE